MAQHLTPNMEMYLKTIYEINGDGELRSIVHQLSSASLPGCQLEAVWHAGSGEVHALVSLQVARIQESLRSTQSLSPLAREDLARRAADAFAAMNAAFAVETE